MLLVEKDVSLKEKGDGRCEFTTTDVAPHVQGVASLRSRRPCYLTNLRKF
jgi:hypothetical protein